MGRHAMQYSWTDLSHNFLHNIIIVTHRPHVDIALTGISIRY